MIEIGRGDATIGSGCESCGAPTEHAGARYPGPGAKAAPPFPPDYRGAAPDGVGGMLHHWSLLICTRCGHKRLINELEAIEWGIARGAGR